MKTINAKRAILILISILIIVMIGILFLGYQGKNKDFFLWCDGYVAAPAEEEVDIAFTFLSKERNLDRSVQGIEFPENDIVSVSDFTVTKMDSKYKNFKFYSIVVNTDFEKTGECTIDQMRIHFSDGELADYPVGTWKFDIGPSGREDISTWESPAVSSSSNEFRFDYDTNDPSLSACTIYTGIHQPQEVNANAGRFFSGKIDISDSEAPVKYIRSKLVYTINGEDCISYGKGCYCGALEFTKDGIQLSCDHFQNLSN